MTDTEAESEREILGIARGGALNIGGQLCSQISFFLITLLLARTLGRSDVAVHLAENDRGALRGTVRLGLGLSAIASVVLGALLFVLSNTLAEGLFGDP